MSYVKRNLTEIATERSVVDKDRLLPRNQGIDHRHSDALTIIYLNDIELPTPGDLTLTYQKNKINC